MPLGVLSGIALIIIERVLVLIAATYWLLLNPVPRKYIPISMPAVLDKTIVVPLLPIGL